MSRAYRVRVEESLRRVVHAEDHVRCQLEILEILPCEQTAELLAAELARLGYDVQGDKATRNSDKVKIKVDLPSATVTVKAADHKTVEVEGKRTRLVYDEDELTKDQVQQRLKQELTAELGQLAGGQQLELQRKVTDELERALADIRVELDGAVNRVTAEALKKRAAQLGQIKSISEDPQAGSLTIVVEV